jgi:hypothetical protein
MVMNGIRCARVRNAFGIRQSLATLAIPNNGA